VSRRFPAPWSVRELEQAFVEVDANGQAVAYTYFRKDENEARVRWASAPTTARRVQTYGVVYKSLRCFSTNKSSKRVGWSCLYAVCSTFK